MKDVSGSLEKRRFIWLPSSKSCGSDEQGQDIAEYAVLVAAILIIVVGTIRLVGSNSNTVFSQCGQLGAVSYSSLAFGSGVDNAAGVPKRD